MSVLMYMGVVITADVYARAHRQAARGLWASPEHYFEAYARLVSHKKLMGLT